MPTKEELLEEKTVKDLKQMARDKDLSGYSRMRKDELVDFIAENYSEKEVETWPDLEGEGSGETDGLEMKEIEGGKAEEGETTGGIEPVESMEEEIEGVSMAETDDDVASPDVKMILVAIILAAIIGVAIFIGI